MAREYARVKVSIWADSDFRLLSDAAQALYFRLLSSPTMSLCGVADWRPNRLAALTSDMTPERVREVADELAERSYIVVDEVTEEVLIRSFVRHDGLIKTPNIAAAMVKDYAGTASATLRGVIVHELVRLHTDEPAMKGWATASKLLSEPEIDPSVMPSGTPSPKASGMPSVNGSSISLPIPSGNGSHIPHPSSLIPQPKDSSSAIADAIPDKEAREDVERICKHLADRIEENGSTRPTITDNWRKSARLLLDKDKRTEEQIRACIDWCQNDSFWMTNILSMPKLRLQYDQLRLKWIESQQKAKKKAEHVMPVPAYEPVPLPETVPWAS
jgi:hypothetical protein